MQTPAAAAARALLDVKEALGDIFAGQVDAMDILSDHDIHGRLYELLDHSFDTAPFLAALAHTRPSLRVLQLGAGKGRATPGILKAIGSSLYKYTFSDLSSTHFNEAKDHLQGVANLEFSVLDVGKPLDEQGFAGLQYDLVIVTDLNHITNNLSRGLDNIHSLISRGGRLLLQELSPSAHWITYALGLLPQWWPAALLEESEWQQNLQQAGFTNVQAVSDADDTPSQLGVALIAQPGEHVPSRGARKVTLLVRNKEASDKFNIISKTLEGQQVAFCTLDDNPPAEGDIISLLDHDGSCFLDGLSSDIFARLQGFLGSLNSDVGIFWLIPDVFKYPQYAQTQGLARVMRSELGIDFAVCEADGFDHTVLSVFERFQARRGIPEAAILQPDMEYAVREGQVYVPRIYPFSLVEHQGSSQRESTIALTTARPGLLSALQWEHRPVSSLGAEDIEIEVYSVGLDYRDLSLALGSIEISASDAFRFGRQAAGVIRRVGDGVKNLQVGDRVMALGQGTLASFSTQPASHCIRLLDRLGLNDCALVPTAFVTAMYALRHVSRLTEGQSVLVHGACSRLGIAAVKVAQFLGATVFATVDDDEQAERLVREFNLLPGCIFQTSSPEFPGGVQVDFVLNPPLGQPVCVAEFGIVIETERSKAQGMSGINQALPENCSYYPVDIDRIQACKPQLIKELLSDFSGLLAQDIRRSESPKVFDASHVQDAFAHLQSAPASDVVVGLNGSNGPGLSAENAIKRPTVPKFDSNASYLLVGGLGGLGRSISIWMVEHGARHLVFLSRSAGQRPDDRAFVNELATMGCDVHLVQGDVSEPDVVSRAVQAASATAPLKGILQMSMVLRDEAFSKISWNDWQESTKPKTLGTWNLHNATLAAGITLDFFTLFSSISGVIGQPGQASYASANAFLDAFCAYRQEAGLAASVVAFGPIDGIGVFSQNEALLRQLKDTGFYCIGGLEVLEGLAVATASASSPSQSTAPGAFLLGFDSTIPLDSEKNRLVWRRDPRMAVYHNRRGAGPGGRASGEVSGSDHLKAFVADARREPGVLETPETMELLAHEIGLKALSLLSKADEELNTSLSLADLGMDSLVAIEMRMWWKQTFQLDISVLEMMGKGSVDALARHAVASLKKSLE